MSSELKAKLAQVAARIAATQERLRGMERSASSLRQDLESLRSEVERDADEALDDEWGQRVPTRPLAVGGVGDGAAVEGAAAPPDGEPGDR
jgi:multidrug resistance efflux pump